CGLGARRDARTATSTSAPCPSSPWMRRSNPPCCARPGGRSPRKAPIPVRSWSKTSALASGMPSPKPFSRFGWAGAHARPAFSKGFAAIRKELSMRAAFFGGIYNNYLALEKAIQDARYRGAEALYCLGDVGGFGPHPDRSIELLREHGIQMVQ